MSAVTDFFILLSVSGCLKILVLTDGSLFLDFYKSFAVFNTGIQKTLNSERTSMLCYSEIRQSKTILSSWDEIHIELIG